MKYYFLIPVLVVLAVAVVVFIVILNAAERRIPVQYAKRVVGRKMYGGQASTFHEGEHVRRSAIIFAQTSPSLPATIWLSSAFPRRAPLAAASTTRSTPSLCCI